MEIDIKSYHQAIVESLSQHIGRSNELWYGTIKLLVSISATILFGTIAIVDKIFPLATATATQLLVLYSGWILLFLSIISCILTLVLGADFFLRQANHLSREMMRCI